MENKLVDLKKLSQILGKSEHALRYHLRMGRIKPAALKIECKINIVAQELENEE